MSMLGNFLAGALAILWTSLAFVILFILRGLASDEIRSRLEQLPKALIRLAARRLPREIPKEIRDDLADEWLADLHDPLRDPPLGPLTRLYCDIRHALSALRGAPSVGREMNVAEAVRELFVTFPRDPLDPADWTICAAYSYHATAILEQLRDQNTDSPERADLLIATARFLLRTGIDPRAALGLHAEALGVRKRLHRRGHLGDAELADGYHNLAFNLRELKEFHRAYILDRHALRVRRSLYVAGDNDMAEHLARSLTSLASDLRGCADATQARPLDEEALDIRRELRRRGHLTDDRDIARSLNNLADDERMLGNLERARQLAEEGYDMRKNLFRGDHPNLALSLDTLAAIHRALGNDTRADQYDAHAHAMRQRLHSRWH